ncbi:MAG: M48 family metalloprotease, partial [Terriglobia bacterium]
VWAAVIGHELGHVLLGHPRDIPRFEAALRQAYAKARTKGYGQRPSPWPNVHLGERDPKLNLSRDQEYQADFIGLMLIADAGYQPGYALILEQRLLYGLGNQPELVSIFSHHPGMESREQRTSEFSAIATDIFRSRWPDAARSPGGNLPPYGRIGRWTFEKEDGGKMLTFRVPFQVHRAANMTVRLAAFFLDHDLRVRSSNPRYRATDGSLILNAFRRGTADESIEVTLQVPASALATRDHKLQAVVFLMAGKRPLDASTLRIDLAAAGSSDQRPHHAFPQNPSF